MPQPEFPLRAWTTTIAVPDKQPAPAEVLAKPKSSSRGRGPHSSPNYDWDCGPEEMDTS